MRLQWSAVNRLGDLCYVALGSCELQLASVLDKSQSNTEKMLLSHNGYCA